MEIVQPYGDDIDVTSINGLTGAVTLAAGSGITLTPAGQTITIASTASSTFASVSAASLTTPNSLYTMTSTIPVEFRRSGGTTLMYLDETNGRVGFRTSSTTAFVTIAGTTTAGGSLIVGTTPVAVGTQAVTFNAPNGTNAALQLYAATSQSLPIFQVSDVAGASLYTVGPSGGTMAGAWSLGGGGSFSISTGSTGNDLLRLNNVGGGKAWYLGSLTDGSFSFYDNTASSYRWKIDTSGHIIAGTDNTYDFGRSLATRVRNIYSAGLTYLGKPTAGGNTQVLYIGHNGTTTSSGDGVAQIQFNSQFDNNPFRMGAEGNGYNFYIRQSNGGQGTFGWIFGTISTVAYSLDLQYITDHYEQIFTGKWLSTFSGTGTAGAFYGLKNTVTANSTTVMYDTFRIERGQANGFYPQSNDPIVSLFAGDSTATVTATNRYVARFNRIGFLGIGTTNTYAANTTMIQAALTVDMTSKSGVKMNDGTTALQVRTSGSSTSVVCLGGTNGELAIGLVVGSRITANSETRTVVSITNSSNLVVDSAVNWDNAGVGYNFTYVNPYISLQDGSVKYFQVDALGVTKSRAGGAATKQATVGGKIKDFTTSVGNVSTGEDDLYTYTTEASLLGTNGDEISGSVGLELVTSGGTATRQIKLWFAGTAIFDTGALTIAGNSDAVVMFSIIRVSSTVVRYRVTLTTQGASLAAYTSVGELTGLTLSNTNIIKLTGEAAGVGAATNDIVAHNGSIHWSPAAV